MKLRNTILALLAMVGLSSATVTLTISNSVAPPSGGVLSNLVVNPGDPGTQRLMWGVVVDTLGNGFLPGGYVGGTDGAVNIIPNTNNASTWPAPNVVATNGQTLMQRDLVGTAAIPTDDVLFICSSFMSTAGTTDGAATLARPLNIASIPLSGNITTGDPFAIVWFAYDNAGDNAQGNDFSNTPFLVGDKYGMLALPALTIPADGANQPYASNFAGTDPQRTAEHQFIGLIPEPSTALLGLLGLVGFVRRRR